MAIVEGAFFKAGLYAVAALIGYRHGADVPGLGPAIDSFCAALGGVLNRQARARATRVASGLEELARAERIDFAPIEATLGDLFARHGLQATELIDLELDPEQAAARVRTRGAALFAGLDEGQPELVHKALIRTYATLIEDTDFLEVAQPTVLRALLAQRGAIDRLPPETAAAVRTLLGGNLLDAGQRLLPSEHPDSMLLRAEYGVVPFDPGRQPDLAALLAWCRDGPAKGICLITAAGGTGKTRLALELARQLRFDDWQAGFLSWDADDAPGFALDELLGAQRDLLIIVDYAQTRREIIEDVLRRLARHPVACRRRVLLLARTAGEWWDGLRTRDGDVRDLFKRLGGASIEQQLGSLAASAEERERAFKAAREALANRLGLEADLPLPDLTLPHFAQALFLHIAAVASLRGERPGTEKELLDGVLDREEGTWRKALDAVGLPTAQFFEPFAQGAALLTLAGGAATAAEARSVLRRVPTLTDQLNTTLETPIEILASLYPGSGLQTRNAGRSSGGGAGRRDAAPLDRRRSS